MLSASGAPRTLVVFGLILGGVGVLAALGLREPRPGEVPDPAASHARGEDVAPAQMLKTPIFWLMFVMMTMISTGGLMVTSNFANFARDFGVADVLVLGLAALPFADRGPAAQRIHATLLRLGVGSDRPRKHDGPRLRT
jgi:hypothetical protein